MCNIVPCFINITIINRYVINVQETIVDEITSENRLPQLSAKKKGNCIIVVIKMSTIR